MSKIDYSQMKIYTKTGDKGQTSLLSGNRVSKYNLRLETYGTVDELNSHIGILRSYQFDESIVNFLILTQNKLFTIGSNLALDENKYNITLPEITDLDIESIEKQIDLMQEQLPPLSKFILPGGHPAVGSAHVCRTVCRRAERRCVQLSEEIEVNEIIIQYLNRLSDYFFVLARYLGKHFDIAEIYWKGKDSI